jgi:chromosome segregation ATPase
MTATPNSASSRTIGSLRFLRSLPSLMERINRLESSLDQARQQVEELRESVQAIDAVRDDVRELTENLTEQLNHISAAVRNREDLIHLRNPNEPQEE